MIQQTLPCNEITLAKGTGRKGRDWKINLNSDGEATVVRDGVTLRTESKGRTLTTVKETEREHPPYMAYASVVLTPKEAKTMAANHRKAEAA